MQHLTTTEELDNLLRNPPRRTFDLLAGQERECDLKPNPTKLLVIKFGATWCGPCVKIAPFYEELATKEEYTDKVLFYECDIDEAEELADYCDINVVPTFQFYRGKLLEELTGADPESITACLEKHVRATSPA
jgi:thioredoxin 1